MGEVVMYVPDRRRFELEVSGSLATVEYRMDGNRIVLEHTNVPEALSGRGVGSRLAKGTLDAVRASGRRALVECEFMAHWIDLHPEYNDIVDR